MAADRNGKKEGRQNQSLLIRGIQCASQFGLKYAIHLWRTGGYRTNVGDVYTAAEMKSFGNDNGEVIARPSSSQTAYDEWIMENETDPYSVERLSYQPLFSVIVPVYNVESQMLRACIQSVISQTWEKWQLILVDDHSSMPSVREVLKDYEEREGIDVIYREENGRIARATNDGIARAKGDFIAFLDCDDVLAPNALYEMARKLNENPELDFIYSDEDKLTEDGSRRHDPFFKPDWSPDTFFSMMYTNHLAVYRAGIVRETGLLRPEFDGAQDYDFTLRFLEHTENRKVGHVDKVLYYWREREESAATGAAAKPYALKANQRAKEDALRRRGLSGHTEFVPCMNQYRVVYDSVDQPLVSVIIPSKDNLKCVTQCIESLRAHTRYPNIEVILVDNGSSDENRRKIEKLVQDNHVRYIYQKMDFNFSAMCNIGFEHSKGAYVLLLNDDIEITQDDWLDRMVGQAEQAHTGAVGAKLLYPGTDKIQHTGVINRVSGPAHILMGFSDSQTYYYGRNRLDFDCFAVTGACLLVSREKFLEAGKMDEKLSVTYNDVDLCINLLEAGYYNVIRNDVILYHHESASRGYDLISDEKMARLIREREYMWKKHPDLANGSDPYYSRHFAEDSIDFSMHTKNFISQVRMEPAGVKAPRRAEEAVCRIEEMNIRESYIVFRGYAYLNKWMPFYLERDLVLRGEAGEKILVPLNRVTRDDLRFENKSKDPMVGFFVRIPDYLLHRERTSYSVAIRIQSAKGAFQCEIGTAAVIPKKQYSFCVRADVREGKQQLRSQGMVLTEFRVDRECLHIRGSFDEAEGNPYLRTLYLAVEEPSGVRYYRLYEGSDRIPGSEAEGPGERMGFYGKIHLMGEVRGILYDDREKDLRKFYPINWDYLCRQFAGEKAFWNEVSEEELARERQEQFRERHVFSILVPLYNTPLGFLQEMIASVQSQTYGGWQLCLADGSDEEHQEVGTYCEKLAAVDSRIVYHRLRHNGGISENTNECMKSASGDYVAFFDHDDLLAPNALYEAMRAVADRPETELIYTDEDKVDESGKKYSDPHFKPDFDPEMICTNNYICHFLIVRKTLLDKVGGLRTAYNGAQDFDFVLRCTEHTKPEQIVHIPKVLYHWRMHRQSTASNQESKMYAYDAAKHAVEAHFERVQQEDVKVERTDYLGYYKVSYPLRRRAGISILIPCRDEADVLKKCVDAIVEKSTYDRYEILVVDCGSEKKKTFGCYRKLIDGYKGIKPVHVYTERTDYVGTDDIQAAAGQDFERSLGVRGKRIREAAAKARGQYLIILDPHITPQGGDWMEQMLADCEREEVDAVCGKTINSEGRVLDCGKVYVLPGMPASQDAGCTISLKSLKPMNAGLDQDSPGYFARAIVRQRVDSVSDYCYMTTRESFRSEDDRYVVMNPDVVIERGN